ncbi:MAG: glutamyl-tRNA reductase [Chloroflexi bacterium]|nr:glutamyl-tRNA reductase [Chloroflexota bacterium]
MQILCLGLNHKTTPLNLRERLVFSEDALCAALARLGCGEGIGSVAEMVILSTCNRIEIYAASSQPAFSELEAFLSETRNVPADELRPHLYRHKGSDAIHHLLKVAAGLDSLVLGESQILGQVTKALELARGVGASGPLLARLFQSAIHAGKRARTETAISRNPASISSLAASVAEKAVGNMRTASVVMLGAGEMAELTFEALRKRGVEKIRVINRTLEHARGLASRWGAESATFEFLEKCLEEADILIASTGAPHTLVSAEMVRTAMAERQRTLVLIDIAVPRDIEAACGDVPGVRLYDIDSLNATLETSLAERAAEVPYVEAILAEEKAKFMDFLSSLDMLPLIADMRQQAEQIRQAELEKTLRRLPDLTDAERARIETLTMALVKKLLESPTARLRAEATCTHAPEYATVARTLFGLKNGSGLCGFSGNECPISTAID